MTNVFRETGYDPETTALRMWFSIFKWLKHPHNPTENHWDWTLNLCVAQFLFNWSLRCQIRGRNKFDPNWLLPKRDPTKKMWETKHLYHMYTLLGINISPTKALLKMILLFPRWDMLVPWRVYIYISIVYICLHIHLPDTAHFGWQKMISMTFHQHSVQVSWLVMLLWSLAVSF